MKNVVFWDVALFRSCVNRRFGRTYLTGGSVCSHLLMLVHRSRIFLPWRWKRYIPPKRRLTQDLHIATSQKTTFLIAVSVYLQVTCWQPTLRTGGNRGKLITETGIQALRRCLSFRGKLATAWHVKDEKLLPTSDRKLFLFVRKLPCHVNKSQSERHSYIGKASPSAEMHLPAGAFASSNDWYTNNQHKHTEYLIITGHVLQHSLWTSK
jgi:hypothetical protein